MKNSYLIALLGLFFIYQLIKVKMKYPVLGRVTSKFGNRFHPVTGVNSFHNGIDIAAPIGTPVVNPFNGKVINVYSNATGGKQLIVKHDNGYITGYAHLSKNNLFKIGDIVNQGETIALTGNSGQSTGAHLHLTLRDKSGQLINPQSVFYV